MPKTYLFPLNLLYLQTFSFLLKGNQLRSKSAVIWGTFVFPTTLIESSKIPLFLYWSVCLIWMAEIFVCVFYFVFIFFLLIYLKLSKIFKQISKISMKRCYHCYFKNFHSLAIILSHFKQSVLLFVFLTVLCSYYVVLWKVTCQNYLFLQHVSPS